MENIISKYNKIINFIHQQKQNTNLNNFKNALKEIQNPQNSFKSIHIAGTNGKGSTCNFINAVLCKNKKVGLFTSPSIIDFTDRIKVQNKNISKKDFIAIFEKNKNIINKYKLSFFEIYTLISFVYFKKQKINYAIIEVGVGGELDPTNIIKPIITAITNVGNDHIKLLGQDLNKRRLTKLGIQKKDVKLFIQQQFDNDNELFNFAKKNSKWPEMIVNSKLSLKTLSKFVHYQKPNYSLAKNILNSLGYKDDFIWKEITNSKLLPCRFERITKNIILDGAHNEDGINSLLKSLNKNTEYKFIYSSLKNKNNKKMIELLKQSGEVVITDFNFSIKDVINGKKIAEELSTKYSSNWEKELSTNKTIIFTGSLYFLSNVRKKIKNIYNIKRL